MRAAEDERLWQAVSRLSQQHQLLIALYYGENMAYDQIAQATGLRPGTVKSGLSRAKEALRKQLEE